MRTDPAGHSPRRAVQLVLAVWLMVGCAAAEKVSGTHETASTTSGDTLRAFVGAEGWTTTAGGRGGTILRVTTLRPTGPGSFTEAANAKGPRIIVFEVGGVIDLNLQTVVIREPWLTIAGQTAPSPGITFIRGGFSIVTHDVVIQHIRVRPGEAGRAKGSGWNADGLSTWMGPEGGAHDLIVDHCSFSWGTDENLSASGEAFKGANLPEWRKNTAHRVTYSNNIVAEGLDESTHDEGRHSKGTLIHDNATDILIAGNLYANNMQRNPLFKGGVWGAVVNNVIYNPGNSAVDYHLTAEQWTGRPFVTGKMALVGNVMRHGPDTKAGLPLLSMPSSGDLELHIADNVAVDVAGRPVEQTRTYPQLGGKIIPKPADSYWPPGLRGLPASQVEAHVYANAGARPWDRDAIDQRIVRETRDRTGRVIDSEREVGGYPVMQETRQAFDPAEWDLRTMTRRAAAGAR